MSSTTSRRAGSGIGRLRARAGRIVGRLLLPARLPARTTSACAIRRLQYGLGSRLGIDLPGEYPGNWPTEEWTQATFGKGYHLEPSDACQLAIGQGAMQATPLQIAEHRVRPSLNGGTLYRPHIVAEIRTPRGKVIKTFDHEIDPRGQRQPRGAAPKFAPAWHRSPNRAGLRRAGDRRAAVLRQDRYRGDRGRPRRQHDVVRRLRAERSPQDRDGGLHGEDRAATARASRHRSRSTSSPNTSAARSRRSDRAPRAPTRRSV